MSRPSKKAKEKEGYNSTANMFWVEDPLTEKEYSQARRNGVKYKTAYTRRHTLGWSKEDTINTPVHKNDSVESEIREKYRDRRIALGISEWMFNQRVFKEGIGPEEFLSDYKLQESRKGRTASVHIITDEQYAIAASNGISRRQLQNRLSMNGKNFPIERAITEPIGTHPSARRYGK
jgi:hypothetical protein